MGKDRKKPSIFVEAGSVAASQSTMRAGAAVPILSTISTAAWVSRNSARSSSTLPHRATVVLEAMCWTTWLCTHDGHTEPGTFARAPTTNRTQKAAETVAGVKLELAAREEAGEIEKEDADD